MNSIKTYKLLIISAMLLFLFSCDTIKIDSDLADSRNYSILMKSDNHYVKSYKDGIVRKILINSSGKKVALIEAEDAFLLYNVDFLYTEKNKVVNENDTIGYTETIDFEFAAFSKNGKPIYDSVKLYNLINR